MVELDPQVQVELIRIANILMADQHIGDTIERGIQRKTELFDQAYKALIKTVMNPEETSRQ